MRRAPHIQGWLALWLFTGCAGTLPTPNVRVQQLDPLTLADAAAPASPSTVCQASQLQLPESALPFVQALPPLCTGPHCLPVASDCEQVSRWCEGREAAVDHALEPPPETFDALCRLATECLQVNQQYTEALSSLAGTELLFASLESESDWALRRFVEELSTRRPDLFEMIRHLAALKTRRTSLLCQAFPLYLGALAQTGMEMVAGHPGGSRHVAFVLADLPPTPALALGRFAPATDAYQRLLDAHRLYRQVALQGGFEVVPAEVLKVKPGMQTAATAALRKRLFQEGLLPSDAPGPIDTPVLNALGVLRTMHGLDPTPPLGATTLDLLQIPAQRKARQLARALIAIRAAIPPWEASFVHVQSPHAFLEVYLDGKMAAHHRTVLGSARMDYNEAKRKRERMYRTPPLSSQITEVILNPEWKVPESIATKEIAPKALEDPAYLERGNYKVITHADGTQLFIQQPGDGNALGRIKFYFDNPYGVYLHDTPSKKYFNNRIRLLSHGCVRVQHAAKLALLLLNRDQNVSEQDIRLWLRGQHPREIPLLHPIPIHITYHTAGADSSGHLFFLKDFYDLEN